MTTESFVPETPSPSKPRRTSLTGLPCVVMLRVLKRMGKVRAGKGGGLGLISKTSCLRDNLLLRNHASAARSRYYRGNNKIC